MQFQDIKEALDELRVAKDLMKIAEDEWASYQDKSEEGFDAKENARLSREDDIATNRYYQAEREVKEMQVWIQFRTMKALETLVSRGSFGEETSSEASS